VEKDGYQPVQSNLTLTQDSVMNFELRLRS
jgi:hypothetical protein